MLDPRESHEAAGCDFLDLYLEDREAGQPRPLREYLARFPGHEEFIAREFLALEEGPRPERDAESLPEGEVGRIGPFRLVRLLGRGGQGVVYLAEDTRLGRAVALKVLDAPPGSLSTARVRRLRREAETLGRLDHPGICTVHEAHLEGERPWVAMRYVPGETVAARLERALEAETAGAAGPSALLSGRPRGIVAVHQVIQFLERAARALHAAHEAGIVHRDIKPGNLMIDAADQPVLLDFGLAREEGGASAPVTLSGELFGTLAYMAPEQVLGRAEPDRRSDVYSLGVTLYECLTLRRPFVAPNREALIQAIRTGRPPEPSSYPASVPRDLCRIVETALEPDPDRRYPTALALAEDLRRVREFEPIRARPAGPLLRVRRWAQRNPVLAVAGAASLVLLAGGLVVALLFLRQLAVERERLKALRQAYYAQELAESYPNAALRLAVEASLREPHQEINDIVLRLLEKYYLAAACRPLDYNPSCPQGWRPRIDPGDRWLAMGDAFGGVNLWDLESGEPRTRIAGHRSGSPPVPQPHDWNGWNAVAVDFSPDGRRLLSGGPDGRVVLWDPETGTRLRELGGSQGAVRCVAFDRTGERAASGADDGQVRIYGLGGASGAVQCPGHTGCVSQAVFDPSGRWLATASGAQWSLEAPSDRTVRVWEARTGEPVAVLGHCGQIRHIEWSPSGDRLLSASEDGEARLHEAGTWRLLRSFRPRGRLFWAGLHPSGRWLATTGEEGLVVWEPRTGERLLERDTFQRRPVTHGAFSPDGSRLAVVSWDESARIYEVDGWREERRFLGHARPMGACWSRKGHRIVTAEENGACRIWYPAERPFLQVLGGHRSEVTSACFVPGTGEALTASRDGTVRLWDSRTGASRGQLQGHAAPVLRARPGAAGDPIVTASADGTARLWDRSGRCLQVLRGHSGAVTDAWFVDGDRQVFTISDDGSARTWDVRTGQPRHLFQGHEGAIACAAFHPGRPWAATGGSDRTVRIWDLEQGRAVWSSVPWSDPRLVFMEEPRHVFGVCFDPDRERILAACEDGWLRSWDIGREWRARSRTGVGTPGPLEWESQGRWLVAGGRWAGSLTFLSGDEDLPEARIVHHRQHTNAVRGLRTHPGRRLVLSFSLDGTARLWDLDPPRLRLTLRHGGRPILDASFDAEGNRVITAGADGTARIWPVDPVRAAEEHLRSSDPPHAVAVQLQAAGLLRAR